MIKGIIIIPFALLMLAGCQEHDTNVITPEAVEQANKDRMKAIDDNPDMTPEGKQKMKEMLNRGAGGASGQGGPSNPGAGR